MHGNFTFITPSMELFMSLLLTFTITNHSSCKVLELLPKYHTAVIAQSV